MNRAVRCLMLGALIAAAGFSGCGRSGGKIPVVDLNGEKVAIPENARRVILSHGGLSHILEREGAFKKLELLVLSVSPRAGDDPFSFDLEMAPADDKRVMHVYTSIINPFGPDISVTTRKEEDAIRDDIRHFNREKIPALALPCDRAVAGQLADVKAGDVLQFSGARYRYGGISLDGRWPADREPGTDRTVFYISALHPEQR